MPTQTPSSISDSVFEMFSMKGKVASVTGIGAGIGLEIAKGLVEIGADVAIWYNSNPKAITRAKKIEAKYGVKWKAYKCEVTDAAAVSAMVDQIVADFSCIDARIVNQGIPARAGVLEASIEDWHHVMDVDLNGALYVARASDFVFRKQGNGSLIFTTSMSAHVATLPAGFIQRRQSRIGASWEVAGH